MYESMIVYRLLLPMNQIRDSGVHCGQDPSAAFLIQIRSELPVRVVGEYLIRSTVSNLSVKTTTIHVHSASDKVGYY